MSGFHCSLSAAKDQTQKGRSRLALFCALLRELFFSPRSPAKVGSGVGNLSYAPLEPAQKEEPPKLGGEAGEEPEAVTEGRREKTAAEDMVEKRRGAGDVSTAATTLRRSVKQLHFGGWEEKAAAATEIKRIAQKDGRAQRTLAALGVIPSLVSMLDSDDGRRRRVAVLALVALANGSFTVKHKAFKLVRWIPPIFGYVLNTDGACKGSPGICGGGGCIRDSNGELLLTYSYYYGVGDSFVAETRALCDGLRLAEVCGIQLSCIWMDSAVLVTSMLNNKAPSWKCLRWWNYAKSYATKYGTMVKHVYREANGVADALASYACFNMCYSVYFSHNDLPISCKGPLMIDQTGLWGIRIG